MGKREAWSKIGNWLRLALKWFFARPKVYCPVLIVVFLVIFLCIASSPSVLLFFIDAPPRTIEPTYTEFHSDEPDEQFYAQIETLTENDRALWEEKGISSYRYTLTRWWFPWGSTTYRITVKGSTITSIRQYEPILWFSLGLHVSQKCSEDYCGNSYTIEALFDYILGELSKNNDDTTNNVIALAFHPDFHIPVAGFFNDDHAYDYAHGFYISNFQVLK
ncbi:MAG: hypothetical protein JW856_00980 [Dehalococcoidales bacterium]|nr:hypothetical protein [Dehalococcoidales bacterium]